MDRLLRIVIWIYWFEFLTGQLLFDNFGARQEQKNSNLHLTKSLLQQFSEGIEKKLMEKLDVVENVMEAKFSQVIETTIRKTIEKEMVIIRNVSSHSSVQNVENNDLTNTTRAAMDILKSFETKINNLTAKFKNLIDRKEFADLLNDSLSTIRTEQQILRQDMVSFTTYFDGKAETLLNNSDMSFFLNLKEAIGGLSSLIQVQNEVDKTNETGSRGSTRDLPILQNMLQNELSVIVSAFESVLNMANQTVFVCTKTMAEKFDDKEPNLENIFLDILNNFTLILEKTLMERQSVLREQGNISEQLSPKDKIFVVGLNRSSFEMIQQFLLTIQNHHLNVTTTYQNDSNTILGSDCADILKNYPKTRGKNGVYNITVSSDKSSIKAVYCDMTTDNGGWTLIQRRVNGSVNFYRNWTDYKNGFGYADHEYWIGNDMLHILTSLTPQELRVDMQRFNAEKSHAIYSNFSVGDEESKYKLNVKGYNGNAGDSLYYSNDMKFSTLDQDNDKDSGNCATYWKSAGWFNTCFKTNPNGQYTGSEKEGPKYIVWHGLKSSFIALKNIQFMIRPRALV